MNYPLKAACQCGQVSYKLHKPPTLVVACHCTECQKLSTSPFSLTAVVSADTIEFSGEMNEWSRVAASGNTNTAKFCSGCGNRVYHFNPASPAVIKLKLKPVNIDETINDFKPTAHVWVSEKVDWYQLPDDVKAYDTQPQY